MSAAIPILTATASANTGFPVGGFNASEYDAIILCANTNLFGVGETAGIYVLDTKGNRQALINPATSTPFILNGTGQVGSFVLPGGYLYQFDKTVTALAIGFDVLVKPRAAYAA